MDRVPEPSKTQQRNNKKEQAMIGRHFILGGLATGGLGWRMFDPKGSYAALYDISHWMTELVSGYEALTRFISLIFVDQFNGLMLGIVIGTVLHMTLGGLKHLAAWPFRALRSRPLPEPVTDS